MVANVLLIFLGGEGEIIYHFHLHPKFHTHLI